MEPITLEEFEVAACQLLTLCEDMLSLGVEAPSAVTEQLLQRLAKLFGVGFAVEAVTLLYTGAAIATNRLRPARDPEPYPDYTALIKKTGDERWEYGRSRGYLGPPCGDVDWWFSETWRTFEVLRMICAGDNPLPEWSRHGPGIPIDLIIGESSILWGEWHV